MTPHFTRRVTSMAVLDYIAWVDASRAGCAEPLTLPPVQRSALWRPEQVQDLWRSLLAGMPIGALYLSPPGAQSRDLGAADGRGTTTARQGGGYDLLDGQQRTNAMLLARLRPAEAGRCVWVAPSDTGVAIEVFLTTRSQPFGFTEDGRKLDTRERRAARETLEKTWPAQKDELQDKADHELYDWHIAQTASAPGAKDGWPPLPFVAASSRQSARLVTPLPSLVAAWQAGGGPSGQADLGRVFLGGTPSGAQIGCLRHALSALDTAEVALILAAPQPNASGEVDPDWALTLFERIGAGGTPLTGPERLYSIYKHHEPYVHDAVTIIERSCGRILSPVGIAVTAICIARARDQAKPAYDVPDPREFGKWMKEKAEPGGFRARLGSLIAPAGGGNAGGTLPPALKRVQQLLVHGKGHHDGLPSLLVVSVDPELLRILAYWAVLTGDEPDGTALDLARRPDVVRFALFWQLCVKQADKAARAAMEALTGWARDRTAAGPFPWMPLVNFITRDSRIAVRLVSPEAIACYGSHARSASLHSWNERFERAARDPMLHPAQELFLRWWRSSNSLLWLQRDYVLRTFPHYDPMSERDEDRPIDLDHIQPKATFGFHFNSSDSQFDGVEGGARKAFHQDRWTLGNSIGNYRWVSSSVNRAQGDDPVAEKLGLDDPSPASHSPTLAFSLIDQASCDTWRRASVPVDGWWTEQRITAWQEAVETRAVWLYERFWQEAGFAAWSGMAAGQTGAVTMDVSE